MRSQSNATSNYEWKASLPSPEKLEFNCWWMQKSKTTRYGSVDWAKVLRDFEAYNRPESNKQSRNLSSNYSWEEVYGIVSNNQLEPKAVDIEKSIAERFLNFFSK